MMEHKDHHKGQEKGAMEDASMGQSGQERKDENPTSHEMMPPGMTGQDRSESRPAGKEVGGSVIGGALNGERSIVVAVEKTGKDTHLNRVIAC